MSNKIQQSPRSLLIFMLLAAMFTALLVSRAALSVTVILFIITAVSAPGIKERIISFISTPLYWGMGLLFVIPLVSGLWSEDTGSWTDILQIKLPLFLLPLAFAGGLPVSKKQWEQLGFLFIALVTAGTLWTLFNYLPEATTVNQRYLQAKTMQTPLGNDHVRFSWLVAAALLAAGCLLYTRRKGGKLVVYFLAAVITWLVVFLHLLAVRTGLFSFYIMLAGFACWLILKKLNGRKGIVLFLLLIALPWVAYKTIPSFHNRVQFIIYDSGYFTKAHYRPGSTDAIRVISLQAGWQLMQANPVTGTGFGDLQGETKQWYRRHYPEMQETDYILPSGEWMCYGAAAGWPGFLLFTIAMCTAFFTRVKDQLPWVLLNGTAGLSFVFDIGLEVQYGVFIYSFLVLAGYQWLKLEKN